MPFIILIILLAIPYLEFLVFLEVSHVIGGISALLLTILSAVVGIYLIRRQGLIVMNRMHETLRRGENPVEDIIHGFFLLIAGVFFLLPGFITDSIAIILIIPPIRVALGKIIIKNIQPVFYNNPNSRYNDHSAGSNNGGPVIDGEFRQDDNSKKNNDSKMIGK